MANSSQSLSESSSLLLDLIRLTAALLVVFAHLSRAEFSVITSRNLQPLGDFAVPVFFVLSGFVIRFVTVTREHTLRTYLVDRAARIYSIALPAMALTLLVTGFVCLTNPCYAAVVLVPVMNHAMVRVLANLSFVSQVRGFNTVQFGDSPFWSLSYECLFYVAYGVLFYMRGVGRVVALALWLVISGPEIWFLFSLWLAGAGMHDLYQRMRKRPVASYVCGIALAYLVVATVSAACDFGGLLSAPWQLTRELAALPNPLVLLHQSSIRATMLALANGLFGACAMLLLLLLSDLLPRIRRQGWTRRVRRLADGTFAIYLMHYPLMIFAKSVGLLRVNATVLNTLTVCVIVGALIAVSGPLDGFKTVLQRFLRRASELDHVGELRHARLRAGFKAAMTLLAHPLPASAGDSRRRKRLPRQRG